jgi:uracil-DNA glycosylase family 4
MSDRRMAVLKASIKMCGRCSGMNIPGFTQAAPGYGSERSPVAVVGQSLCGPCMKTQIPFSGGSGLLLDRVFERVGVAKKDLFITNVVHCHPPDNRPSLPEEIANCSPYLRRELDIVKPVLVIGLGQDARAVLTTMYPQARQLDWPFRSPPDDASPMNLLCPPHPAWIRRQNETVRDLYVRSLASAIAWAFARDPHADERPAP